MNIVIEFDGAAEPNPGRASWGVVVRGLPEGPHRQRGVIPGAATTNNVAEYAALEQGLRFVADAIAAGAAVADLTVRGDSQLVIKQIDGSWACRAPGLLVYRDRCRVLIADIVAATGAEWRAEWIPREQNADADALSVQAWEEATNRKFPERAKGVRS